MENELQKAKHSRLNICIEMITCMLVIFAMSVCFQDVCIIAAAKLGVIAYIIYVFVMWFLVVDILYLLKNFNAINETIKNLSNQEDQK